MPHRYLIPHLLVAALAGLPGPAAAGSHAADPAAGRGQHAHQDAGAHHDGDDHLTVLGDVRLLHAWTRATDDASALVFVEIENTGDAPVTLTGGASDLAEAATLVGFTNANGQPDYQPLPALPVAPGTEMVLAPQGVALQLDGLSRALAEGDRFEIVLTFDNAEADLTVAVEAADATRHSHAGHMH